VLGVPAWQLDGVFLGATRGPALRNAAIAATLCYIALDLLLVPWGAVGLWLALLASYGFRAVGLAVALPSLVRGLCREAS
jgi:multidrug resistance protein, MATE family